MINLGKKEITTIIFDNNGVLTTNNAGGTFDNVARFLGVSVSDLKPIWEEESKDSDEGKITGDERYKNIISKLEKFKKLKNTDAAELKKVHLESYKLKKEMLVFANAVKSKYNIALLTNFGDGFDECNENHWKLNELFEKDRIFVSAKLKMRKPNADIYQFVLGKMHVEPVECVFIDDSAENVEAAIKLGMKGIVFKDLSDLKRQLSGILGRYFF